MSIDNKNLEQKFTETFRLFKWSHGMNESKSGLGSTVDFTIAYRKELLDIIDKYNIKTVLDCSCGDWNWMRLLADVLPDYTGLDIVRDIVDINNDKYGNDKTRFICSDMLNYFKNTDKTYDLVISRHTFEHLQTEYVLETMSEIKKKTKYFLFSGENNLTVNNDINFDGCTSRNINLALEPYQSLLGDPIYVFFDTPINPDGTPQHTHVLGNLFESK